MNEKQKNDNKEACRRYRERLKNNPEKHELRKAKQRERNKIWREALKADPEKYELFLQTERERSKQRRQEIQINPEKKQIYNNYQKQYAKLNKQKIKNYESRSPEAWKKRNIARRYNITVEQYDEMVKNQNGCCLLCNIKPKKIVVDHCHKTGKVRALLCNECNTALGLLRENTVTLQNAINYLEKHKGA